MEKKVKKMRIGTYLVKKGFLSLSQAQAILDDQSKMGGATKLRFGRIAINKGFIKENQLNQILLEKERVEFGY